MLLNKKKTQTSTVSINIKHQDSYSIMLMRMKKKLFYNTNLKLLLAEFYSTTCDQADMQCSVTISVLAFMIIVFIGPARQHPRIYTEALQYC